MPLLTSRLFWEVMVACGAAVAIFILWQHHDLVERKLGEQKIIQADKAATEKQAKIDAEKLSDAEKAHAQEIANLKSHAAQPSPNIVRCFASRSMPAPAVHTSSSAPTPVVQQDTSVYRDIEPAIRLLIQRADKLSADTRELNAEIK